MQLFLKAQILTLWKAAIWICDKILKTLTLKVEATLDIFQSNITLQPT